MLLNSRCTHASNLVVLLSGLQARLKVFMLSLQSQKKLLSAYDLLVNFLTYAMESPIHLLLRVSWRLAVARRAAR